MLPLLQVGEGSIAALSTAGLVSKFGFPLQVRTTSFSQHTPVPVAQCRHWDVPRRVRAIAWVGMFGLGSNWCLD